MQNERGPALKPVPAALFYAVAYAAILLAVYAPVPRALLASLCFKNSATEPALKVFATARM